jgi:hypothetical protein
MALVAVLRKCLDRDRLPVKHPAKYGPKPALACKTPSVAHQEW